MAYHKPWDWTAERDAVLTECLKAGMALKVAAGRLGCSVSHCSRRARKLGMPRRNTARVKMQVARYVELGWSDGMIALELGLARTTIAYHRTGKVYGRRVP